jgi:hypothetical protein
MKRDLLSKSLKGIPAVSLMAVVAETQRGLFLKNPGVKAFANVTRKP